MAYNKNLAEIDSLPEYIKVERTQLIFETSWNAHHYLEYFWYLPYRLSVFICFKNIS